MNVLQKDYTTDSAAKDNGKEKLLQSFASLLPGFRQIVYGIVSWAGLLGMMGVIGGMDQGTISFKEGAIQAVICLAIWVVSLKAGGWIN